MKMKSAPANSLLLPLTVSTTLSLCVVGLFYFGHDCYRQMTDCQAIVNASNRIEAAHNRLQHENGAFDSARRRLLCQRFEQSIAELAQLNSSSKDESVDKLVSSSGRLARAEALPVVMGTSEKHLQTKQQQYVADLEELLARCDEKRVLFSAKVERLNQWIYCLVALLIAAQIRAMVVSANRKAAQATVEVPEKAGETSDENGVVRSVLDEMKVGVVLVDIADQCIEFTNRQLERMLKIDRSQMIGKSLSTLFRSSGNEIAKGIQILDSCTHGKRLRISETVANRNYELELTAAVESMGGREKAIFCVRDITAELEAESMKRQFIALISHEIKTPITSIRLFLDYLSEVVQDTEIAARANAQCRNSDRLLRLLNDLLDIEKMDSENFQLNLSDVVVSEWIQDCIDSVESLARERETIIVCSPVSDEVIIHGDQERLAQALINLLSNAIKYSPKRTTVLVELDHQPDSVTISVVDQGPGISADKVPQLFDRYYQASASTVSGSVGLGLAICRSIVSSHKGTVGVSSTHQGSRFWIKIPCSN